MWLKKLIAWLLYFLPIIFTPLVTVIASDADDAFIIIMIFVAT